MKLSCCFFFLIMTFFVFFAVGHAEEFNGPYDLSGTWKLDTKYAVKKLCKGRPAHEGNKKVKAIIEQSGTDFTMTFLSKDGSRDRYFEGRISNDFIGAEVNDPEATAVLAAKVLGPDKMKGVMVFYVNSACPDAESGAVGFKAVRILE